MPEISRFYGIIIRMFMEPGQHNRPHFHAYYQEYVAIIAVDEIEVLAGNLPKKQQRLSLAWAELHKDELMRDWNNLQNGQLPDKIEPIK